MLLDATSPKVISGLVGWWPLYEGTGTTMTDRSGLGNNGTLTNMESGDWVTDVPNQLAGYALQFGGTNEYVSTVGAISTYSFIQNTGIFSISAWLKLTNYTANAIQIIMGNTGASVDKGMFFAYENRTGIGNNELRVYIAKGINGTPIIDCLSGIDGIADNNWHHIVAVGDGTNVICYIDGVAQTTSAAMGSKSSGDSTRVMNIARYNYSTPGGYLTGSLDDIRIYNRALSLDEVITIYRGD